MIRRLVTTNQDLVYSFSLRYPFFSSRLKFLLCKSDYSSGFLLSYWYLVVFDNGFLIDNWCPKGLSIVNLETVILIRGFNTFSVGLIPVPKDTIITVLITNKI